MSEKEFLSLVAKLNLGPELGANPAYVKDVLAAPERPEADAPPEGAPAEQEAEAAAPPS